VTARRAPGELEAGQHVLVDVGRGDNVNDESEADAIAAST
jgi:hypothetical protein